MVDDALHLRRATLADAEGIAAVHLASSQDAYAPLAATWDPPDVSRRAARWREWLTATERIDVVAEADGEIVGFVSAGPARRSDVDADVEVYVIHVLPERRGREIGDRLWAKACKAARGPAARSMFVATFAELRCCSFYEARGGEIIERLPGRFKGGPVTKLVYRWAAGQSHAPTRRRVCSGP